MRTYNALIGLTLAGLALGLAPSMPFDASDTAGKPEIRSAAPRMSSADAMRIAFEDLKGNDQKRAVTSLLNAADHGNEIALWQLGHMYATGKVVPKDDYSAFKYYRMFADRNSSADPMLPFARYVADAFVVVGHYYLTGIPNSPVLPNPGLAQKMFNHAAKYFGDPEAQYQLACLLLDGKAVERDPVRAVQWLNQAANKRHYSAQALLGRILFKGEVGRRDPASGLMWLIVAFDASGAKVPWIAELHDNAFKQASDKERAEALVLLERWVEGRR